MKNNIDADKVKSVEKPAHKSIIVSTIIHDELKDYCKIESLKIGGVIETLIREFLKRVKSKTK